MFVCLICIAQAVGSVLPHSVHNWSVSNCRLYDGGILKPKTKKEQKNIASFLTTKDASTSGEGTKARQIIITIQDNDSSHKNTNTYNNGIKAIAVD